LPDKSRDARRDREFTEYAAAQRVRLLRTARLLTAGDDHAAEDLVQATLTRLYVNWPKVRRAGDPVGYGFKSLSHAFVDERRRAHVRREQVGAEIDPGSTPPDPVELRQAVLAALAGLPPRQRAVVVLRHWLDYDVATTADALGCSTGTVKSQNAKALAHLRLALGEQIMEGISS
jgi:RNA polymerase sigma-70 factor (sigma-E family)